MADDPPSLPPPPPPLVISKRLSVGRIGGTSVSMEKNVKIDREGERKAD